LRSQADPEIKMKIDYLISKQQSKSRP